MAVNPLYTIDHSGQEDLRVLLSKIAANFVDIYSQLGGGGGGGGGGGLVTVSSGTIASPVHWIDITIPTGYDQFQVILTDIGMSDYTNHLACAFKFGSDWLNDLDNENSYSNYSSTPGSLGALTYRGDSSGVWSGNYVLQPGSGASFAALAQLFSTMNSPNDGFQANFGESAMVNTSATVTPTAQRMNTLRFVPASGFNGTSGESGSVDQTNVQIIGGTYILLGVPSP